MLFLVLPVGLVYLLALIAALLATGSSWRRAAALGCVLASLPATFWVPAQYPTFRALVGLTSLWFSARILELIREPRPLPVWRRLWHAVGMVDTLHVTRVARGLDAPAFIRFVICVPLGAASLTGVFLGGELLTGVPRLLARWGSGAVFIYAGVEVVVSTIILMHGALGIDPRPLHDDPIRSRTLAEFWGRRWNRAVHRFLKQTLFAPVARRGYTQLGLVLAFAGSGFIHFAFMWPAVGLFWAGMMGVFFLLQLPLVWAERALGVARWRAPLARTWTLGLLLISSPLFVEPMLKIIETWR